MKAFKYYLAVVLAITVALAACSKDDDNDINDNDDNGNDINPADTVAIANLVAYFPFDGDIEDEMGHETSGENYNFTFDRYTEPNSALKDPQMRISKSRIRKTFD